MSLTREELRSKSTEELLERFQALCKGVLKMFDIMKEKGGEDVARPAMLTFVSEATRRVN